MGHQEDWWRYKVAANELGGAAWELANLPEPERSYWLFRGLMSARAQAEAMEQDRVDKALEV